jgi:D-aminoacyl-tRNA deacylase
MIGIIASAADLAAKSMLKRFGEKGFKEAEKFEGRPVLAKGDFRILEIKEDIIHANAVDAFAERFDCGFVVFASRHRSESGRPALTVHPVGNFGDAALGGRPRELAVAAPNAMRRVFLEMLDCPFENFEVTMEATHHGPTEFNTPIFFAELGSSEKEWRNAEYAAFVADCILEGCARADTAPVALGFGSTHYCAKFTPMMETLAFGHVASKHAVDSLDHAIIQQMAGRSSEKPEYAVLDSGLAGRHKVLIKRELDELGIDHSGLPGAED